MNAAGLASVRAAFGCGDALAQTIAALGHERHWARGQAMWPAGEAGAGDGDGDGAALLLTHGRAQEAAYGRDGAMVLLQLLEAGDLFGDLAGSADDDGARVEALLACTGRAYGSGAMVRLMESYPCVAVAITRQFARRLLAMRRRMAETALLSATGRIAAQLLRQARAGDDWTIRPTPVFAELAVGVQSTRETVSRTVSAWERRGLVKRVDGGLKIVAPHRLEELVL